VLDPTNPPTPSTMTLPDARTLAWYEFGDPRGLPCVFTPGTPVSGLSGAVYDDAARAAGIRWISVDKPGYGHSDFQPGRTLLDWATDIDHLTRHLGIDTYAAAGESGGGPYTLALAAGPAEHLTCALIIAGLGQSWDDPDGKLKPSNRQLVDVLDDPAEVTKIVTGMKTALDDPAEAQRFWAAAVAEQPQSDRDALAAAPGVNAITIAALADALRDGVAGAVYELTALSPWNFELPSITTHVYMWHGTEDSNVPLASAQGVAAQLPQCTPRWVDNAGHNVGLLVMDEVMSTIRSAAGSTSTPRSTR
jgi:pimeloyl-ACP methyl ester carboxylesterase